MRRAADLLWGRRAPLALAAAVLALRAPGFLVGFLNLDECDFWLFGRMVRAGALPYREVTDIKPPLTYAAFWLFDALTLHHRRLAIPLLGVAAVLGAALLLRAAARRWTGDERIGWAAAWLSLAAGLCEFPTVNAEILMNVPAAAALWALAAAERTGRRRWDLLAGVLAGLATLCKLQAGILLLALVAAALLHGRRGLPRALATGAGYALPWALATAGFAAAGVLPEAYDWVVRRNVFQISSAHVFAAGQVIPTVLSAVAAAGLAWWLALRQLRAGPGPADGYQRALAVLLVATALPVSIGQRFYQHYFLQWVPPLALLGAPQLPALADRWAALSRRTRALVLALPLLAAAVNVGAAAARAALGDYPGQEPRVRAIAGWLRQHTAPDQRLFVWGDYSVVYCEADRLPGTRYLRTAPHVGDFDPLHLPAGFDPRPYRSQRDIALALADLTARRPELVVDTSPSDLHRWSLFPLALAPELDAYVQAHYRPVATPAGAVVYLRRDLLERPGAAAGP